jgi:RNA polymerase sigma-70 factor (ECF subfamily)
MSSPAVDSAQTKKLLEQVRAGKAAARDRLFARHRPYLERFVAFQFDARLRSRVDPSDVVQDAQLEAARRLEQYLAEPPMPFRLWLRQIAYDQLVMLRRRHLKAERRSVQREVQLPDRSSVDLARQLLAQDAPADERLVQAEFVRRVREAIARLSPADRDILMLRNFEGLTNQEVAHLLAIDPTAASQRYGRALLRLRKLLLESGLRE